MTITHKIALLAVCATILGVIVNIFKKDFAKEAKIPLLGISCVFIVVGALWVLLPLTLPSADVPTPEPTAIPNTGDWFIFGSYQSEPIEWRVLAVENGRTLVISEKILDAQPYK